MPVLQAASTASRWPPAEKAKVLRFDTTGFASWVFSADRPSMAVVIGL
jgi:hypothetical protein